MVFKRVFGRPRGNNTTERNLGSEGGNSNLVNSGGGEEFSPWEGGPIHFTLPGGNVHVPSIQLIKGEGSKRGVIKERICGTLKIEESVLGGNSPYGNK